MPSWLRSVSKDQMGFDLRQCHGSHVFEAERFIHFLRYINKETGVCWTPSWQVREVSTPTDPGFCFFFTVPTCWWFIADWGSRRARHVKNVLTKTLTRESQAWLTCPSTHSTLGPLQASLSYVCSNTISSITRVSDLKQTWGENVSMNKMCTYVV